MSQNRIIFQRRAEAAFDKLSSQERGRVEATIERLKNFAPGDMPFPLVQKLSSPEPIYIFRVSDSFRMIFKRVESSMVEILDIVNHDRLERMYRYYV